MAWGESLLSLFWGRKGVKTPYELAEVAGKEGGGQAESLTAPGGVRQEGRHYMARQVGRHYRGCYYRARQTWCCSSSWGRGLSCTAMTEGSRWCVAVGKGRGHLGAAGSGSGGSLSPPAWQQPCCVMPRGLQGWGHLSGSTEKQGEFGCSLVCVLTAKGTGWYSQYKNMLTWCFLHKCSAFSCQLVMPHMTWYSKVGWGGVEKNPGSFSWKNIFVFPVSSMFYDY